VNILYKISYLTWNLTHNCNYSCHFCDRKNNDLNILSENDILKIIDFINIISNNENFTIHFFGGEPTTSQYLLLALDKIKSNKQIIETNLYKDINYLNNLSNKMSHLITTFHAQYADPNEFYEKIEFLYNKNIDIRINFTFEDNDYEYIKEKYYILYCKIKENFSKIKFIVFPYGGLILDNKISELFEIIRYTLPSFYNQNKECYKIRPLIESNGDVYQCLPASGQQNKNKPFYNIINDKNALNKHKLFYNMNLKCKCEWCC
jgi:sulfatase maturation enzyme AslB (radical SAM superfamily)